MFQLLDGGIFYETDKMINNDIRHYRDSQIVDGQADDGHNDIIGQVLSPARQSSW